MKKIYRMGFSIISSALLAIATSALPAATPRAVSAQDSPKGGVQLQSASGTISTVQKDSFTLVTSSGASQGQQLQHVDADSKTMMFIIDANTAIDGKLQVGANADVVYRQDAGNNIAVSVTVSK